MPTLAEKAVSAAKIPVSLKEPMQDVKEHAIAAYEMLDNAPPHDPIHLTHENHGLHAYRYEEMTDGSVVALFANTPDGDVKMKAFENIDDASAWTPRDERDG